MLQKLCVQHSITNEQLVSFGLILTERHFQKLQAHIERLEACDED